MNPSIKVLGNRELWDIHCASLDTLEHVGVDVHDEQAREALLDAGARADGAERIRLPAKLVKSSLDKCSPVVLLHGREGVSPLRVGGSRLYYGTCGYPTSVLDWRTGEFRAPLFSDLEEAVRLTDVLENIDFIMPPLSPEDVDQDAVDRYQWMAGLLYTRKPVVNQCYDAAGLRDMVTMASEVAGGRENLLREPFVAPLVCTTSPLILRRDACEVIMGSAALSLPLFVLSGPMAGGSAPASLAGVLAMTNAELLATMVLTKAVNEDAPFIYASWARTLDMKYANIALGAPEFALLRGASAQLARMYGLPCGGGGLLTDSQLPDAQAGYEKLGTALLPALSGFNMICGAASYGGELVLSLEGYMIDDEVISWVKRMLGGFAVDDKRLAADLVAAQGPGGQFVEEDHTFEYYRKEMWIPTLSERAATVAWQQKGGLSVRARARRLIRENLEQYRPLSMPDDMRDRLQAIIDRR